MPEAPKGLVRVVVPLELHVFASVAISVAVVSGVPEKRVISLMPVLS